ncbi:hypothetical protein INH39_25590 [Massilia violaceinigra]|uniref:Uncharacterized protein n=1 Tax=Massilia violaceinigra TaxID=2045208 RepID=A0ABY4A3P7_9BURK|nr:hypothetical protein [Massilia violaceinigra]UOD28785.1 hypothetical protein INH39_25590 [Massilia violaceinigra]
MSIIATTAQTVPEIDYFWLIAQIKEWAHRTDLDAKIPTFVLLAEKRIKTMLRPRVNEAVTTITATPGVAFVTLPSRLLHTRALSIPGLMPKLDYVTAGQLEDMYSSGDVGVPRVYTTVNDAVYFGPVPDAAYSIACTYRAEALQLNAADPVNSLLTAWPNVYLFGALVELAGWLGDDAAGGKWESKFQDAIASINVLDWHAGGPMSVRTDVRNY